MTAPAGGTRAGGPDTRSRAASTGHCPHCGTAVEGAADQFCCSGCEIAASIIRGAGLERYYRDRTEFAPRPEVTTDGDWNRVPSEPDDRGLVEARLVVDGLRCASCVWVTEKVLERTPGVDAVTISYASGRATLRWDPRRVDLAALARRIAALGYRPRPLGGEPAPDRGLMLRLGVAVFAAMNIMLAAASLYAGWWDSMDPGYAALFRWTNLLLATPVALWCAEPFFAGAWSGLRHRVLHMDLPIALGVAILYGQGLWATLAGHDGYLDSLAMLVALLLLGRVLEGRGRRRASEAATALAGAVPATARRLGRSGAYDTVPVAELRPGDRIDVGAGEELAADGLVAEGSGQVRMALVTGEAAPVLVAPGDRVVAGTLLADGALTVQVEAVGHETVVQRMAMQLQAAQDRGMAPSAADRIAPWFTAMTLVIAALTFAFWWRVRDSEVAVARMVAVLVVACPCALALAQPLAAAAGLGAAARRGLLLRSADALLCLGQADRIALDKTGTVTAGALLVTHASDADLRIAAGLERYSSHPIARAITAEATRRGIPLPQATEVQEVPGEGISGVVDGRRWELRSAGAGLVALRRAGAPEGTTPTTITLGDASRNGASAAVARLQDLGLSVTLLTGDHRDIALAIGREAGITEILARLDPAAKTRWIAAARSSGQRVAFVGDGLNDGPALAEADVGIAMAEGAASSVLVADGIVARGSLTPVVAGIVASRAATRMIRISQRRALAYNALAVTAAAAGLVNPLVAAVLMPLSSGLVIWNAARVEGLVAREDACTP